MLVLVAAIWGAAGPIIKFTLKGIDPLPFLTYRFFLSSMFSLFFFLIKIKRGKKFKKLRANFGLALLYSFLAVPLALGTLFLGLDNSTVLDLTLIGVVGPLMVTLGGAIFFHEHITNKEKLGIAIVLLGVVINSFIPLFSNKPTLSGNIFLLIYLLSDSSSILIAKKAIRKGVKSANLTNLTFMVGFLSVFPLAILIYGLDRLLLQILLLPLEYHLGVWYMSFLSGTLAYFLYVRATRSIEVSEAVLFFYLQPIFSIPLAIFWLKESLSMSFLLGAIIILIGLIVAETKKRSYNNKAV